MPKTPEQIAQEAKEIGTNPIKLRELVFDQDLYLYMSLILTKLPPLPPATYNEYSRTNQNKIFLEKFNKILTRYALLQGKKETNLLANRTKVSQPEDNSSLIEAIEEYLTFREKVKELFEKRNTLKGLSQHQIPDIVREKNRYKSLEEEQELKSDDKKSVEDDEIDSKLKRSRSQEVFVQEVFVVPTEDPVERMRVLSVYNAIQAQLKSLVTPEDKVAFLTAQLSVFDQKTQLDALALFSRTTTGKLFYGNVILVDSRSHDLELENPSEILAKKLEALNEAKVALQQKKNKTNKENFEKTAKELNQVYEVALKVILGGCGGAKGKNPKGVLALKLPRQLPKITQEPVPRSFAEVKTTVKPVEAPQSQETVADSTQWSGKTKDQILQDAKAIDPKKFEEAKAISEDPRKLANLILSHDECSIQMYALTELDEKSNVNDKSKKPKPNFSILSPNLQTNFHIFMLAFKKLNEKLNPPTPVGSAQSKNPPNQKAIEIAQAEMVAPIIYYLQRKDEIDVLYREWRSELDTAIAEADEKPKIVKPSSGNEHLNSLGYAILLPIFQKIKDIVVGLDSADKVNYLTAQLQTLDSNCIAQYTSTLLKGTTPAALLFSDLDQFAASPSAYLVAKHEALKTAEASKDQKAIDKAQKEFDKTCELVLKTILSTLPIVLKHAWAQGVKKFDADKLVLPFKKPEPIKRTFWQRILYFSPTFWDKHPKWLQRVQKWPWATKVLVAIGAIAGWKVVLPAAIIAKAALATHAALASTAAVTAKIGGGTAGGYAGSKVPVPSKTGLMKPKPKVKAKLVHLPEEETPKQAAAPVDDAKENKADRAETEKQYRQKLAKKQMDKMKRSLSKSDRITSVHTFKIEMGTTKKLSFREKFSKATDKLPRLKIKIRKTKPSCYYLMHEASDKAERQQATKQANESSAFIKEYGSRRSLRLGSRSKSFEPPKMNRRGRV